MTLNARLRGDRRSVPEMMLGWSSSFRSRRRRVLSSRRCASSHGASLAARSNYDANPLIFIAPRVLTPSTILNPDHLRRADDGSTLLSIVIACWSRPSTRTPRADDNAPEAGFAPRVVDQALEDYEPASPRRRFLMVLTPWGRRMLAGHAIETYNFFVGPPVGLGSVYSSAHDDFSPSADCV